MGIDPRRPAPHSGEKTIPPLLGAKRDAPSGLVVSRPASISPSARPRDRNSVLIQMSRPDNFASVEVCRTGFLARPCGRSDSSTSKTHKQPQPYKSTRNYKYQTHYLHDCPPRIPPIFSTCFGRNQQHRTQHYSANIPRYVAKLLFLKIGRAHV